jgi:hemolysin activation/secretion protein
VQQLSPRNLLVARIDTQLTPDSLLSLERFSMGGVDTVRGYRQNQLVADNGILGSVEVRVPLTSDPRVLQLAPFFEIGTAWNNREIDPDPNDNCQSRTGFALADYPQLIVAPRLRHPLNFSWRKRQLAARKRSLLFSTLSAVLSQIISAPESIDV